MSLSFERDAVVVVVVVAVVEEVVVAALLGVGEGAWAFVGVVGADSGHLGSFASFLVASGDRPRLFQFFLMSLEIAVGGLSRINAATAAFSLAAVPRHITACS